MTHLARRRSASDAAKLRLPVLVRRDGRLVPRPPGELERDFDFGDGPRRRVNVSWGDVVTATCSTGVPNVEIAVVRGAPTGYP